MIDLRQVPRLVFGSDAMQCASAHLQSLGVQRPFILTTPVHRELAQQLHAQAIIDCSR